MEKITLKDIGIYAVMGVLVQMLSSGIVSLISMVSSRLLPTVVQLRFANIVLILAYAIIYPLLWSRRECTAMLRGEDVPDVSAFVRRFMRIRVVPQVLVQFAVCLLICAVAALTKQISPVSSLEMYLWTAVVPFPILISCRIVVRRQVRDVVNMRKQSEDN